MIFAYDTAKDSRNLECHGVSLGDAARMDWGATIVKPDKRREYGEARLIGYGPIGDRLYCVVFADRGHVLRIISLRRANRREVVRYEAATRSPDR